MADESISEEEYERWLAPAQALSRLAASIGPLNATGAIVRRLESGQLRAVAKLTITKGRELNFYRVPVAAFEFWTPGDAPDFWTGLGDLILSETDSTGYGRTVVKDPQVFQVRLDPDGIAALMPKPPDRGEVRVSRAPPPIEPIRTTHTVSAKSMPPSPISGDSARVAELGAEIAALNAALLAQKPHAGGAPSKPWWDDLWVEMFRQIWEGDLKPTAMAHIANAMMQWASDNGREMSELTAKRAARKLWAVADPNRGS